MSNLPRDPHRHFEDVVRDLKREHRGRHHNRSLRYSRPHSMADLAKLRRTRWVLGIVVALGLAVAVALLIPT